MSRKRDLERLRDDEIARLMDESDSEDDLDDLNGGGGGWIDAEVIDEFYAEVIDADREVIDEDREVIDEEEVEDGSEGEGEVIK